MEEFVLPHTEVYVTPGIVDESMIKLFTEGACHVLSSVIYYETGYPCQRVQALFNDGDVIEIHEVNYNSLTQRYYDILGSHSKGEVVSYALSYLAPNSGATIEIVNVAPIPLIELETGFARLTRIARSVLLSILR